MESHGDSYTALCPAHADSNPSLSVTEDADGKVLLCCHSGCEFTEIVKALGLQPQDLFPNKASERDEPASIEAASP